MREAGIEAGEEAGNTREYGYLDSWKKLEDEGGEDEVAVKGVFEVVDVYSSPG